MIATWPAPPTTAAIRAARDAANLTQAEAGALLYCAARTWQDWELGNRRMMPALFELFVIKTS